MTDSCPAGTCIRPSAPRQQSGSNRTDRRRSRLFAPEKGVCAIRSAILALVLLSACSTTGPEAEPSLPMENEPDPALVALANRFETYFEPVFDREGPPGAAVVLVADGQVILRKGYGVESALSCRPVGAHTVFRVGSLSKGFAGVLTAILVGQGRLGWEDPVRSHYPEFMLSDSAQATRIQVRHLLSHATGLPYHAFDLLVEQGLDLGTIVREHLPFTPLYFREGTQHRYQNAVFSIIEPVLENATGQSYTALLRQFILEPGRLQDASCTKAGLLASKDSALPHVPVGTGYLPQSISDKYYSLVSSGGMNLSISDMGAWLLLLLGERQALIDEAALRQVFRPVVSTGAERPILPGWIPRDQAYYGLGWRVLVHGSDTIAYHGGFVNNYHAEIALDRHRKLGIGVLFNGNTPLKGEIIRKFFAFADQSCIGRDH